MTTPIWRTSSHSGENGACVEVALNVEPVRVRDTKDRDGGTQTYSRPAWHAFLTHLRTR
ncbi:protein of unknown function [Amycolatopsis arida]|uniref:DUF397 domain-containing protein n=1 Tax=Amycolatopsis arida TaxID=587909 RepID=A0A1I5QYX5_9PSEU|nr:DUF397 domain-containing protein [Amycolatopsis arida]TDX99012.1 uncharacterized protein DUF397 [Amycolatopsis arida]SFP51455.1 protein of unknown function [Amycolatopsis arida]